MGESGQESPKTINHRDTEAQRKTKSFLWFSLCLCVSVVNGFLVLQLEVLD
jgi:hypothetical protein